MPASPLTVKPMGRRILAAAANVLFALALMAFAWGDPRRFFLHPARAAAAVLLLIPTVVGTLFTASWEKQGRQADEGRWFQLALALLSNVAFVLVIFLDGHDIWVMPGGNVLRYAGLIVLAAGVVLRAGPMVELGQRFSLYVLVRNDHRLETRGFYSHIRHPSYAGVLLMTLGIAGVFRSWVGLALFPVTLAVLTRRMNIEERFMMEHFGDEYRSYIARTWRLLPGIY